MTATSPIYYDENNRQLICRGDWNLARLPEIKNTFSTLQFPDLEKIEINGQEMVKMDSAGAWLLHLFENQLNQKGIQTRLIDFSPEHQNLFTFIEKGLQKKEKPRRAKPNGVYALGKKTVEGLQGMQVYFAFVGQLAFESLRITRISTHRRYNELAAIIYKDGYQALPIIALLSFLIGVVLAYQVGNQLRNYGASIYIVDLLGLGILREFGPLLTAIIIAGRTGAAFTAQLGTMKINQEIDALNTMGVTPAELLILPRIVGLLIALPLLTIWADLFGVLGGMAMANSLLSITPYDFVHRFPHVIPLRSLFVGLGKAPIFALIIASIGCFEGMRVKGSATSVGVNTTRSVVLNIFFIIVADAVFSVIFSLLKL